MNTIAVFDDDDDDDGDGKDDDLIHARCKFITERNTMTVSIEYEHKYKKQSKPKWATARRRKETASVQHVRIILNTFQRLFELHHYQINFPGF